MSEFLALVWKHHMIKSLIYVVDNMKFFVKHKIIRRELTSILESRFIFNKTFS